MKSVLLPGSASSPSIAPTHLLAIQPKGLAKEQRKTGPTRSEGRGAEVEGEVARRQPATSSTDGDATADRITAQVPCSLTGGPHYTDRVL